MGQLTSPDNSTRGSSGSNRELPTHRLRRDRMDRFIRNTRRHGVTADIIATGRLLRVKYAMALRVPPKDPSEEARGRAEDVQPARILLCATVVKE